MQRCYLCFCWDIGFFLALKFLSIKIESLRCGGGGGGEGEEGGGGEGEREGDINSPLIIEHVIVESALDWRPVAQVTAITPLHGFT